jgi:prepilin-type N-terminal cleavage/methylation domain-containing protein
MKTLLKDKSGFTLVEMLVVLALLGILMTGVYEFMSTSSAFDNAIGEENDYQNLATNVMQDVRTQLSNAESVEAVNIADPEDDNSYEGGYTYLVGNTSGGYTVYVCSVNADSGSKSVEKKNTVGSVAASKGYKVKVTYQTSAGTADQKPIGNVAVTIKHIDEAGAEIDNPNDYELSSDLVLRSAENGSGGSIRFKTPVTTP